MFPHSQKITDLKLSNWTTLSNRHDRYMTSSIHIIESVDSISRDERDAPLTQYITMAGITRARYILTHFKHHHRVLWLISN